MPKDEAIKTINRSKLAARRRAWANGMESCQFQPFGRLSPRQGWRRAISALTGFAGLTAGAFVDGGRE